MLMAFKMNITAQIRSSNPTSPLKAMLIPKLDQVAEGLVQAGFECIYRDGDFAAFFGTCSGT